MTKTLARAALCLAAAVAVAALAAPAALGAESKDSGTLEERVRALEARQEEIRKTLAQLTRELADARVGTAPADLWKRLEAVEKAQEEARGTSPPSGRRWTRRRRLNERPPRRQPRRRRERQPWGRPGPWRRKGSLPWTSAPSGARGR